MKKNTIDLHGLIRDEAFIKVEDELLRLSSIGAFEVHVITGNSKPMRDGVIAICERHGFDYHTFPHNLGEIVVNYYPI